MAYQTDPGSILSNAVFGPDAFAYRNEINGTSNMYQDPATGQWFQWGDDPNWMGDSSNPGAWNPVNFEDARYYGVTGDNPEQYAYDPNSITQSYYLSGKGLPSNDGRLMDSSQIKVVDKIDGGYLVMAKTGDKQGTVYAVVERPDGQYQTAGVVQDGVEWDTNKPWWKENIGILSVVAAPIMAYAGQVVAQATAAYMSGAAPTLSAALDAGFQAANAALTNTAGMAFPVGVGEAASFGANSVGAAAFPTTGVTEFLGGPSSPWVGEDLWGAINSGATVPPGFTPPPPEYLGGPSAPWVGEDLPGAIQAGSTVPPGFTPPTMPPDPFEAGFTGEPLNPDTYTPPNVQGPPGGTTPGVPPVPPGGNTPGGPPGTPTGSDPLSLLLALYDSYNKYQGGKDIMDFANRIYGKADWFENELQQSYQNPDYYFNSPEFQALSRVTANNLRRRDAKEGILSNDTRFARDFYDRSLLAGLTPYRTGLVSAANLGKQNSATALKGYGEGLNMRNGALSPVTFNAGNQAGNAVNQTNQFLNNLNQAGGTLRDIWNWGSSFFG